MAAALGLLHLRRPGSSVKIQQYIMDLLTGCMLLLVVHLCLQPVCMCGLGAVFVNVFCCCRWVVLLCLFAAFSCILLFIQGTSYCWVHFHVQHIDLLDLHCVI